MSLNPVVEPKSDHWSHLIDAYERSAQVYREEIDTLDDGDERIDELTNIEVDFRSAAAALRSEHRVGLAHLGLVDEAMSTSARTLYASEKRFGVSDIGGCRRYVQFLIDDEDFTDPRGEFLAAYVGTAVGDHLEQDYIRMRNPHARAQMDVLVPVEVVVDGEVFVLEIPGHPDLVEPREHGNTVVDYKGLALDTPIPTPAGWSTMGDLSVGDEVFDLDGSVVEVTATSQVKNIGCYRVTFANGHSIVCDEEHLWLAQEGLHGDPSVVEVRHLHPGMYVPTNAPLDTASTDLVLDPWMLGYWLGNGAKAASMVSTHRDDVEEVAQIALALDYIGLIRHDKRSKAATVSLGGGGGRFIHGLRALGIEEAKRVPDEYLRASEPQRLAILQGLMDSDGYWNPTRGRAVFTTTTRDLADDVAELARSLGQRVQTHSHPSTGYGLTVEAHIVEWTPTINPFRLHRKADPVRLAQPGSMSRAWVHKIESVERIESVPTRCISVDSPTSTYLCGSAMIPTHNTKDGLGVVIREDGQRKHKYQITLYAKGLIRAGVIDENARLALVYYDRSGHDEAPHTVEWDYDESIYEEAVAWLSDVIYAKVHGEEAEKDQPRAWCEAFCPMFTICRTGDTDVTGIIRDPDQLAAIALYDEAHQRELAAKKDKAAAAAELQGVAGHTPDGGQWRWVHVGDTKIEAHTRRGYERVSWTRPKKK
jgi:hypothetical protein